jgi:hypothetical protein
VLGRKDAETVHKVGEGDAVTARYQGLHFDVEAKRETPAEEVDRLVEID